MRTICIYLLLLTLSALAFGADNPINSRQNQAAPAKMAYPQTDDYTFIRRLMLDTTGTLPNPNRVSQFVNDQNPNKRARLIDEALASDAFNNRWTAFFDEMFSNQTLFDPGAKSRNEFHKLLREGVINDTGWDETARKILTYSGPILNEKSSFVFWQTQIMDSEFRLDQLDDQVAYITDTFLGVQTRCISCHNGKYHLEGINEDLVTRKRSEFWGMAAFLASTAIFIDEAAIEAAEESESEVDYFQVLQWIDTDAADFNPESGYIEGQEDYFNNGEYVAQSSGGEGMRPARAGGVIQPVYMFTGETPAPGETRREALARIVTADRQFARNMVNRIWAHYFGEGFVNPVNGFDLARLNNVSSAAINAKPQPYDSELMETITDEFIASGYKLRPIMRTMLNSKLYQLDYENLADPGTAKIWPYWGGNRRVRRLESEAIVDALYTVTGVDPHMMVTGLLDEGFKSSTWQLPGSIEPNPYAFYDEETGTQLGNPADYGIEDTEDFMERQYLTMDLLRLFGRGSRIDLIPRNNRTNIQTALGMMNGDINNWLVLGGFDENNPYIEQLAGQHQSGQKTTDQVIDELYLRVLIRQPDAIERAAASSYIGGNSERVFDLLWALVNLPEFLYR